jgi:hypothetical protein
MEVKKMNRKILSGFFALMASIMLAACFSTAFALTTNVDYEHAGALCYIQIPDSGTWVRLQVFGQMQGNYYDGHHNADRIIVSVLIPGSNPGTTSNWVAAAGYEDNPTRSKFSAGLGIGSVEYAVKSGKIQVLREGDSNTVMVHWNIPLVAPATAKTPAVTIPPAKITLQGYGDIIYSTSPGFPGYVAIGSTSWGVNYEYHYYLSNGLFFCNEWGIKWQTAGQGPLTTQIPRVIVDRVWTWIYPFP